MLFRRIMRHNLRQAVDFVCPVRDHTDRAGSYNGLIAVGEAAGGCSLDKLMPGVHFETDRLVLFDQIDFSALFGAVKI